MSISACNFPIKQGESVPWRGECPVADAISKRQTRAKHVKSVDGWWHIPPRLSIPKALGRLNGFLEILRFGFFLAHPKIGWRWLLKMTTGHWLSIIVWPITYHVENDLSSDSWCLAHVLMLPSGSLTTELPHGAEHLFLWCALSAAALNWCSWMLIVSSKGVGQRKQSKTGQNLSKSTTYN